jgi:hypothetical protein
MNTDEERAYRAMRESLTAISKLTTWGNMTPEATLATNALELVNLLEEE